MRKTTLLAITFFLATSVASASEHHSGHGGGAMGGGGSGQGCTKPHLAKFLPEHLATVVPGATFSFIALNIYKPEQISVTVKNIPVEIETEFKDPYYLVTGKLPESLHNTAARINIKVTAKTPRCEAENGWLLKIADQ
ncbi:MAG: hypothetical protein ACXW1W_15140 [Methylococcaceae bacterium]